MPTKGAAGPAMTWSENDEYDGLFPTEGDAGPRPE